MGAAYQPGKLSYWATGVFLTPTKLKCASIEAGAGVGSFTYVPEGAADAAAGPYGDTCDYTTWVIDATATSITGSCYQWNTSAHSLAPGPFTGQLDRP